MFMRNLTAFAMLALFGTLAMAADSPGLGKRVSADEIAAADLVILPNGDGLPEGSGTAVEGAVVYQNNCLACHGEEGANGINDRLAGGHGSLVTNNPRKTVGSFWPYATTIFDYVRRAMPYQTPGVLSNDELYAVTAYLLYVNKVIEENDKINASTLPDVHMPNRDNFVWDYEPEK
jgi:S-disulfanyl-L-cysteine oxidoreductase SoxD